MSDHQILAQVEPWIHSEGTSKFVHLGQFDEGVGGTSGLNGTGSFGAPLD